MKTVMLIDTSVMKDMIEGLNKDKVGDVLAMFKKFEENDMLKKEIQILTTQSAFLRAIFLAEEIRAKPLQQIIQCVTIYPSFADFRNEKDVMNEIIEFARMMSGGKNE
jgi:hypothetical protein